MCGPCAPAAGSEHQTDSDVGTATPTNCKSRDTQSTRCNLIVFPNCFSTSRKPIEAGLERIEVQGDGLGSVQPNASSRTSGPSCFFTLTSVPALGVERSRPQQKLQNGSGSSGRSQVPLVRVVNAGPSGRRFRCSCCDWRFGRHTGWWGRLFLVDRFVQLAESSLSNGAMDRRCDVNANDHDDSKSDGLQW